MTPRMSLVGQGPHVAEGRGRRSRAALNFLSNFLHSLSPQHRKTKTPDSNLELQLARAAWNHAKAEYAKARKEHHGQGLAFERLRSAQTNVVRLELAAGGRNGRH